MATATYPYDPTGEALTNRISNELQNIQHPTDISDASFIIPRAAPFFLNSLKVKKGNTANAEVLLEGIHYIPTHHFVSMSYILGTPIYSSITLLNKNYTGNVYLDYQTIGGQYVMNSYTAVEELTRQVYSVYSVTWEQVAGLIQGLPPTDHKMAGDDTTGYGELIDAVKYLAATIRDKSSGSPTGGSDASARIEAHLMSGTAHTKDQVGLSRVENFALATSAESRAGAINNKYMTPLLVNIAIKYYLEQAGIATTPVTIENLLISYNNLASRVTGVNDNLNTASNNLSHLASQLDNLANLLQDTKVEFGNNVNSANQAVDLLSRDLLNLKAQAEDLQQDIFFNETEITETNRKLTEIEKGLAALTSATSNFSNTLATITERLDKLDPSKTPEKVQYFLGGFHTFKIPANCKAKIILVGAVTIGNTDPDTKMFEGSKYDSSNNSYYSVIPNLNSPVAIAPGGVAGTLTGRVPSHSLPNAVMRSGNAAALQANATDGVTYTGGDGVIINSVVYGSGISGAPNAASAGAAYLETNINNATSTPLTYHIYVGEGRLSTTLAGLFKASSGICVVELTTN